MDSCHLPIVDGGCRERPPKASHAGLYSNLIPTLQDGDDVRKSEPPKMWAIGDPFQYSPPKLEGDPWLLLLEPLMKKDKMRCDAWKDEVQNLLIFAGLFSAVVTAFIMESYKNLQADPNDAMIHLLSYIATRLDSPLDSNSTNTNSSSVPTPFSPSPSSIRVNIFWFISLVLSLTTVLVGIISLQWLREHQHYPDLTPRQRYAVYHMRVEGIEKWHVNKIFAALPLLLQCALILFLAGLVDFLRILGEWTLTTPVAVVIGLTLLFLISTTLLPSLQGLSLYFHLSSERSRSDGWQDPASQCPYKSPQSHATRILLRPIFRLLFRLHPRLRYFADETWRRTKYIFSKVASTSLPEDNFSRYIYFAFRRSKWIDFDLEWLSIRDAYMRRAFGRSSWYEELGQRDDDILPIHDLVQGLRRQSYQKSSYSPAYYCLSELSELVLLPLDTGDFCYHSADDRCRQNAYLHDLLCQFGDTCLSDYFVLDSFFGDSEIPGKETKTLAAILHQQTLFSFLRDDNMSDGALQSMHRKELALRLMQYFYQEQSHQLRLSKKQLSFPTCLAFNEFDFRLDRDMNRENFNAIVWQFANATLSLLQQLDTYTQSNSIVWSVEVQQNALSIHMETASCLTSWAFMPDVNRFSTKIDQDIKDAFYTLFIYVEERLNNEISSWADNQAHPSLLFYTSALYAHHLASWEDAAFRSLHSTLSRYKSRTIDVGIVDSTVEGRLIEDYSSRPWMYSSYSTPFSSQWWNDFNPQVVTPSNLAAHDADTR
ncbi:hypothetical protein CVT25_005800 [Psilocybe cyanescens]|uniref:DUF6535 domain-containing protein n=1 Tax=Psilocybe cyanescens TaxID=93625 RepID=A0A409XA43_PSICY|nr:hypothetical protein CVT25_005800 [Psilocybe cyanescens]